jgi:hypothetical protein
MSNVEGQARRRSTDAEVIPSWRFEMSVIIKRQSGALFGREEGKKFRHHANNGMRIAVTVVSHELTGIPPPSRNGALIPKRPCIPGGKVLRA